jgi:hypothetical protein
MPSFIPRKASYISPFAPIRNKTSAEEATRPTPAPPSEDEKAAAEARIHALEQEWAAKKKPDANTNYLERVQEITPSTDSTRGTANNPTPSIEANREAAEQRIRELEQEWEQRRVAELQPERSELQHRKPRSRGLEL